jgi:integrase
MYGNSRLRTGDYLEQWLPNHTNAVRLEEKTRTWYDQVIRVHLVPEIGHIPLSRLSPQAIQDLYDRLLQTHARRRRKKTLNTLSRTTVRHIANMLHLALGDAVKRGLIARNPVEQTEPPQREKKIPTTLTPTQLQAFLEDAKDTAPVYIWALYMTKAGTGMRFGELLGLRENDLDLDDALLMIDQTLKRPGRQVVFGKPKTERSRRTVTLPSQVVESLRQLRRWKREERLRQGSRYHDYGLVFSLPNGKPLHANNIRRRDMYPRLERLGLPRIRPHDLRHTHGTRLALAGVDARTIADRLGHSSPSFTMQTYVHGVPESQRHAADIATKLLPNLGPSQAGRAAR